MSSNNNNNAAFISSMINKYTVRRDSIPVENVSISIPIKQRVYKLIRLNDEQFYKLFNNAVAILDDYTNLTNLYRNKNTVYHSFSKMYVALKQLFGESGKYYDSYKSSFSFPLLVSFEKEGEEFGYLMNIINFRASIEFKMRKLIYVDDSKVKRDIQHQPFEEFPQEEKNYLIDYLIQYLTIRFEDQQELYNEPFFMEVESNLILFGYKDGCFFDEGYDNVKKYEKAIQNLRKNNINQR